MYPSSSNSVVQALNILWDLRALPGLLEDGVVDAEALLTWISEARRLCKERGREAIGIKKIGELLANAPAGADGIWPCEPVRNVPERRGECSMVVSRKGRSRSSTARTPHRLPRSGRSLPVSYVRSRPATRRSLDTMTAKLTG